MDTSGVTGTGSLTPTGRRAYMHRVEQYYLRDEGILHDAWSMHSIYVDKDESAAWLVIEGAEDPNYEPLCWTNAANVDFGPELYQPMEQSFVVELLERATT